MPEFSDADNHRRWQLIDKEVEQGLTQAEVFELAELQRRSMIAVEGGLTPPEAST